MKAQQPITASTLSPPLSPLVVGTRGSALARAQTTLVIELLRSCWPDLQVEVRIIRTEGDRKLDVSPLKLSKGTFVREIEVALLRGEIDLAVHSCKDLPTDPTPGLVLGAIPQRADPRDALVSRDGRTLAELLAGARVGTSSSRRKAQILMRRQDLQILGIRGNVDTRLRKLRDGQYDAVVLAAAGLERMGWLDEALEIFEPAVMLPAPGQGALAVQIREDDIGLRALIDAIDHRPTHAAVVAERAFLRRLGGGCRVPIAAYAQVESDRLTLQGLVVSDDGSESVRGSLLGAMADAAELGAALAEQLLERTLPRWKVER